MQALSSARAAVRRSAQQCARTTQRRTLATEPDVPWADYRAGKVSLQEWVDGNRYKVAGAFFFTYLGLLINAVRPKKKKPADEAAPTAAAAETK